MVAYALLPAHPSITKSKCCWPWSAHAGRSTSHIPCCLCYFQVRGREGRAHPPVALPKFAAAGQAQLVAAACFGAGGAGAVHVVDGACAGIAQVAERAGVRPPRALQAPRSRLIRRAHVTVVARALSVLGRVPQRAAIIPKALHTMPHWEAPGHCCAGCESLNQVRRLRAPSVALLYTVCCTHLLPSHWRPVLSRRREREVGL